MVMITFLHENSDSYNLMTTLKTIPGRPSLDPLNFWLQPSQSLAEGFSYFCFVIFISSMYCMVYPGEFWEAYKGGVGDYWGRKCSSTSRHSKGDHDQWLMSKEKSDIWTKDAIALQSRLDMTNLFPDAHSSQCSVKLAPSRPPSPWRCLCQVMMRTINGSDADHHDNDLPTK